MTTDKTKTIAQQNDKFRQGLCNDLARKHDVLGIYLITNGIIKLRYETQKTALDKVMDYDRFEDCPQHDFGRIHVHGNEIIWKICYYDIDYDNPSEDPSDLSRTRRVLIVTHASEYQS